MERRIEITWTCCWPAPSSKGKLWSRQRRQRIPKRWNWRPPCPNGAHLGHPCRQVQTFSPWLQACLQIACTIKSNGLQPKQELQSNNLLNPHTTLLANCEKYARIRWAKTLPPPYPLFFALLIHYNVGFSFIHHPPFILILSCSLCWVPCFRLCRLAASSVWCTKKAQAIRKTLFWTKFLIIFSRVSIIPTSNSRYLFSTEIRMMSFTLFNGVSVQHSEFVSLFDDGNVCVGVFRASKIYCASVNLSSLVCSYRSRWATCRCLLFFVLLC